MLRSGAHWHDLPERYGKYESVHKRFSRWAASGVWEKIFRDLVADRQNLYLMIDSTTVRAHQQAAMGRKKGRGQSSGAFPRRSDDQDSSLGQRTRPASGLSRYGGHLHDCTQAIDLLGERLALALDDREAAISLLYDSHANKDAELPYFAVDPRFDSIQFKRHPNLQNLSRRFDH